VEILNLKQGSDEWIEARLNHFCASEAPAIMGDSKFMSRNQLLDLKKGWKNNPDSSFKQALFQRGHESEDSARVHIETEMLEDIPPVVGSLVVDDLLLLASYDGYGSIIWEHKEWNSTLSENVANGVLEPMYIWQLEHQMLVAGNDQVTFTCSDGTIEKRVSMVYHSKPERRAELIAGWKQFAIDLESHQLEAKAEKVVAAQWHLPSVDIDVSGTEITTNLSIVIDQIKELADEEMGKELKTDKDFADKESLNKDVTKLRKVLKEKVASVKSTFKTYADLETMAGQLDSVLQKMESAGKKQVQEEKQRRKLDIAANAQNQIDKLVSEHNEKINPLTLLNVIGAVKPDFLALMKGKSSLRNIKDDIDAEVAKQKIIINEVFVKVSANQLYMKENAQKYRHLFSDLATFINQDEQAFQAIVKTRIADEEQRLEAEREAIRIEEEAKAERRIKEALEKKQADEIEAHSINQHLI
jgi:predicted phage-related endonuclease